MATQAEVDLVINASGALPQVQRDLQNIVTRAEDGAPEIDLDAALDISNTLTQLQGDLADVVRVAEAGADDIDVDALLDQAESLAQLRNDLDDVISSAESGDLTEIELTALLDRAATLTEVRRDLDRIVADAERTADDIDIDVDIDVDRNRLRETEEEIDSFGRGLARLGSVARGVGGPLALVSAGVTGVGAATGSVLPLVAGLVSGLESMLPATAVATTGLLSVVVAAGTLAVGMQGVGEAIEAAFDPETKPEDLAAAMDALAPSAQAFVTELSGMQDGLRDLRLDVQERLFAGLDDSLRTLADSALPDFRASMEATADTFNAMGKGVADAAAELSDNGTLGTALDGATKGLENLIDVPPQIATGFIQLAAAAAPAFDRITARVGELSDSIAERLGKAFESGALESAISDAIDAINQFGRVIGNIFGIIGNVLDAAATEGEGFFGTMERVTGALQDATASDEFRTIIQQLVQTMTVFGDQVGPLFTQALSTISGAINTLAPVARQLLETLGPALLQVMEALDAPLQALAVAFGEAVVALLPLVTVAGDLIAGVLPVLTPLFATLGEVIAQMAPFIAQLAENIGTQLTPLLEVLPGIMEEILPLFTQAASEIFPALTQVLAEVSPHLSLLATELAELAVQMAPVIADFIEFSATITTALIPVLGPVLSVVMQGAIQLLVGLSRAVSALVAPLKLVGNVLTGDFSAALTSAGTSTEAFKNLATQAFDLLAGNALRAMNRLASDVGNAARRAGAELLKGTKAGIDRVQALLRDLPGIARAAVGSLGGALVGAGASLIQGLINGITSKIGEVRSQLSTLTNLIPDWKGPMDVDKKLLTPNGEAIMDSLMAGFDSRLPEIRAQLGGLTATLPQSLGMPAPQVQPVVFVTIGNEAVDQYVTTRVRRENETETRILAQGIRR